VGEAGEQPQRAEEAFTVWVNGPRGNNRKRTGAVVKSGRDVMKTVLLEHYGRPGSDKVSKRSLRFSSHDRRGDRVPDFEDQETAKSTWFCENDEIDKVVAFLNNEVGHTGRYRLVDRESPIAALADLLNDNLDAQTIVDALAGHTHLAKIVSLLAASDAGILAAESAVLDRRRDVVARLRKLVDDPGSTETQVQNLIGNAYWVFGGRYVGVAGRRSFVLLDQTDIPLLGADDTLHIVELKGPSIPRMIVRHRSHWIVGPAVHEATAQAMNYLRSFDENGLTMAGLFRNELGQNYDMSRVFAMVVIGHAGHHLPVGATREDVTRTLRQYSASLNRIEVITYDQLVDSAERPLDFDRDLQGGFSAQVDQVDEAGEAADGWPEFPPF
jgi:hypothetical protein